MKPTTRLAALALATTALLLATTVPEAAATGLTQPLARTVWLCRPGLPDNPCDQNTDGSAQTTTGAYTQHYVNGTDRTLDATAHAPDTTTTTEPYAAPAASDVDCFYAYPTVDTTSNPPLRVGSLPPTPQDVEMAVTLAQVSRLAQHCRLFVPVYRQASLIEVALGFVGLTPDTATGAADVLDAWDDYWAHDNIDPATGRHRGVVLLGHSQGTAALVNVIQQRVDNAPDVRDHLVSALLLGGNVQVPDAAPAGGGSDPDATFQHVPACARASATAPLPTGCVVAYSTFDQPDGQPPAADAVFGRSTSPGHHILCVNPAALLRGDAPDTVEPLDTYLPTRYLLQGDALFPNGHFGLLMPGYTLTDDPTGYARYPGTVSGGCASARDAAGTADWLQIGTGQSLFPDSARTSGLGLHVADFNVAQGDLVQLVARQSAAWLADHA
ncbi:DUF3089 domain-containing protein [Streptomyces sp. NPDC094437]|uniref:DUF3089 domain-containing protein n=1 Tax=Streptomyces sp. NPDC094437 TaxID=3366060 RepID=UPI0037F368C8